MKLFLVCVAAMAVLVSFVPVSRSEDGCTIFKRHTMLVDVVNRKVELVGISPEKENICSEIPLLGDENVEVEVVLGGSTVIKRRIQLNLQIFFDESDENGNLSGGRLEAKTIVAVVKLPDLKNFKGANIVLRRLGSGRLLARGEV